MRRTRAGIERSTAMGELFVPPPEHNSGDLGSCEWEFSPRIDCRGLNDVTVEKKIPTTPDRPVLIASVSRPDFHQTAP